MKNQLKSLKIWNDTFGVPYETEINGALDIDAVLLRYKLMREENEEYLDAAMSGDTKEVADALGDKLYILCGTILAHGMQDIIEDVFAEIQRSNMSKLAPGGRVLRREDGKILKGSDYSAPDLQSIINRRLEWEKRQRNLAKNGGLNNG